MGKTILVVIKNNYVGIIRATIAAGPTDISAEVPNIEYKNTGINEEYKPIDKRSKKERKDFMGK